MHTSLSREEKTHYQLEMMCYLGRRRRSIAPIFWSASYFFGYLVSPVNPKNPVKKIAVACATLLLFTVPSNLPAQNGWTTDADALSRWIINDAPPGREHLLTDLILQTRYGWQRDQLGNLILRKGSGSPR